MQLKQSINRMSIKNSNTIRVFFDRTTFKDYVSTLKIAKHFSKFGRITGISFYRDAITRERTGMGNISFYSAKDAQDALKKRRHEIPGILQGNRLVEIENCDQKHPPRQRQ